MVDKFPARRYEDDGRGTEDGKKRLQMLKKQGGEEDCAKVYTASTGGRRQERTQGWKEENEATTLGKRKGSVEGSPVDMITETPFCHRCDTRSCQELQYLSVHNRKDHLKYSHSNECFMRTTHES
jgi:hypothetical protein